MEMSATMRSSVSTRDLPSRQYPIETRTENIAGAVLFEHELLGARPARQQLLVVVHIDKSSLTLQVLRFVDRVTVAGLNQPFCKRHRPTVADRRACRRRYALERSTGAAEDPPAAPDSWGGLVPRTAGTCASIHVLATAGSRDRGISRRSRAARCPRGGLART